MFCRGNYKFSVVAKGIFLSLVFRKTFFGSILGRYVSEMYEAEHMQVKKIALAYA